MTSRNPSNVSRKATNKEPVPTENGLGLSLASLPDDIIIHIGKTVAGLCGVKSYVALAETSKRFKSLLKDYVVWDSILTTETHRILVQFAERNNMLNYSFGLPMDLIQLRLWQSASEAMQGNNKIYFIKDEPESVDHASDFCTMIGNIMLRNPDASVMLEAHCGTDIPNERSELISLQIGMGIALNLVNAFGHNGREARKWVTSHIFIRPWRDSAAASAIAIDDVHAQQVAEGKGWVDVFFRVNDVQFPPRSILYEGLDFPEVISCYDHHDMLMLSSNQANEERILNAIQKSLGPNADPEIMLESFLVEFRVTGTTSIGPCQDLLQPIISRREEVSASSCFVVQAENEDSYGLLIEIITKAGRKKPKRVLGMMKEDFLRHGSIGMGPFLDRLLRDVA